MEKRRKTQRQKNLFTMTSGDFMIVLREVGCATIAQRVKIVFQPLLSSI
jgi:hypothetical protein